MVALVYAETCGHIFIILTSCVNWNTLLPDYPVMDSTLYTIPKYMTQW